MQVIKKGRPQKGWSVETTCMGDADSKGGCGAVLLVEQDDIYTFKTGGSYCEDANEMNYAFTCPECGVETVLKSDHRGIKMSLAHFPTHILFQTREAWERRKDFVDGR